MRTVTLVAAATVALALTVSCRTTEGDHAKGPTAVAQPVGRAPFAGMTLAAAPMPCDQAWSFVGHALPKKAPAGAVCDLRLGVALVKDGDLTAWIDDDLEFAGRYFWDATANAWTLAFPWSGRNGERRELARWDQGAKHLLATPLVFTVVDESDDSRPARRWTNDFVVVPSPPGRGVDGADFTRPVPWGTARRTQTLTFRAGRAQLTRETGERFAGSYTFEPSLGWVTLRLAKHREIVLALTGKDQGRRLGVAPRPGAFGGDASLASRAASPKIAPQTQPTPQPWTRLCGQVDVVDPVSGSRGTPNAPNHWLTSPEGYFRLTFPKQRALRDRVAAVTPGAVCLKVLGTIGKGTVKVRKARTVEVMDVLGTAPDKAAGPVPAPAPSPAPSKVKAP